MIKTFITSISLQGKGELLRMLYKPIDFTLEKNRETSFPIIPVIASEMVDGEKVRVIAVRAENADTPDNFEAFIAELKELGIERENVVEITVEENQSKEKRAELLLKLLETIPEDSLVYTDITFGTKPMSAILLYAMSFVEKVKDSEVEGIYYGEIPREGGKAIKEKAALYDLTTFKYMGDMIEQLHQLEIKEPLVTLRKMLN